MLTSRLPRSLVALGLAFIATVVALFARGALRSTDQLLYDIGMTTRPTTIPNDIVILGIDQKFLRHERDHAIPRDKLAMLINNVVAGEPEAIALDVRLDSRLDIEKGGPDEKLKASLLSARKLGIPVVLTDLPALHVDIDRDGDIDDFQGSVIPYFREAARTGSVDFRPDADGAVRLHPTERPGRPSLPAQMARIVGAPEDGLKKLESGTAPIDFAGPPGSILHEEAADFLDRPLGELLNGRVVFIGAMFPRSHEMVSTPYSQAGHKKMYRVELLAQATDSLRRGAPRFSHDTNTALLWDFFFVFLGAWAVGLSALRGTAVGIGAAICAIAIAAVCAALSAHHNNGLWALRFHPVTPFLLGMPAAASGGIAWRSIIQARELTQVRDTFGAYVGAQVLENLGGKMPELGGETRQIAVLFCDIQGYATLAESLSDDPKTLLDELNGHFTPLVAALQKRGAYVDNYLGDMVMALFGAPVSTGDYQSDVRAAVLAALDFIDIIEARNKARCEAGLFPIQIGIGVHCGEAVVGNVGSNDAQSGGKIHYTAIGDVVNVASRIESATRWQNVTLLVTREVVEVCGQDEEIPDWTRIGEVNVKGRVGAVEVFTVCGKWARGSKIRAA